MKAPTTGELRERLTFSRADRVDDGEGGYESVYLELGTCWAKCVSANPSQRLYQGEVQYTADVLFVIRYQQRFVLSEQECKNYKVVDQRGETYSLLNVARLDNRNDFLVLTCKKYGANTV